MSDLIASSTPKCIVIGVSAGGLDALTLIVGGLPEELNFPIVVVQHRLQDDDGFLADQLNRISRPIVKEAEDKEPVKDGVVYIAPPNYHLLIDDGPSFSLSCDELVNYCRPSVDVLFESAANIYTSGCVGVVLTGYNNDGAHGLCEIVANGGKALVQNPTTAFASDMPLAALAAVPAATIFSLEALRDYFKQLSGG